MIFYMYANRGDWSMEEIILHNDVVLLRKMTLEDVEGIYEVALDDRIWTYTTYTIKTLSDIQKYVEDTLKRSEAGLEYPFVIIDRQTNKIVGCTRYYNIDASHKRLELGFTWITPTYWRTAINTNAKFLLLQYCFEQLKFYRLQFAADERNERSRKAILRIGAKSEGILRKHMICKDGFNRNSAIFSVIDEDWPETKEHLGKIIN